MQLTLINPGTKNKAWMVQQKQRLVATLKTLLSIMDVTEEEDLFERITTTRYAVSYMNGTYTNEDNVDDIMSVLFRENQVEERINHINLFISSYNNGTFNGGVWQILEEGTTLEEATETLKTDLKEQSDLKVDQIFHQKVWDKYFPRISKEYFKDCFQERIEALQGQRNTYFLGSELSFHSTQGVFDFAKDLVERKFPNITNAEV